MEETEILMQQIKTEAKRLGFLQIGISFAAPPHHFQTFQSWIAESFHGNMDYLQRNDLLEKRKNPTKLFQKAISIITLIYPCYPLNITENKEQTKFFGQVASFSFNEDYHTLLQQKAEHLCEFISAKFHKNINYKICVDSSPILEREYAVQSGLGWIGKNANFISPTFGSFVLLCEILIDVSLPISSPFEKDFCGKCTRCVEACPTKCIKINRTIDARQCISYLTIENPSEIPDDLRHKIGYWIFGCDVCQLVCPWNQRLAEITQFKNFKSSNPESIINLLEELQITEKAFKSKYKGTPINRAKFLSYKRNLIIAIGNSRNPAFLPCLEYLLTDPYFQTYAKWAIDRITI